MQIALPCSALVVVLLLVVVILLVLVLLVVVVIIDVMENYDLELLMKTPGLYQFPKLTYGRLNCPALPLHVLLVVLVLLVVVVIIRVMKNYNLEFLTKLQVSIKSQS